MIDEQRNLGEVVSMIIYLNESLICSDDNLVLVNY